MKTSIALFVLSVVLTQSRTVSAQTFAFGAPYYQICLTSSQLTPGTVIGQISTTVPGSIYQVIYPNSNIAINPSTGALTLINNVQSGSVQVLQVQATSPSNAVITTNINVFATSPCTASGGTGTGTVTSTISSVTTAVSNANAPQFASSFYTFIPSTCSPGSLVGTLTATSSSPVTYSLSGTSAFSFTSPSSGNFYLTGTPPATYPATFTVTATNASGSRTIGVNVYLPSTCSAATTFGPAPATVTAAPAATTATTRVITTPPTVAPGVPAGADLG